MSIRVKTEAEQAAMRQGGRILAQVLQELSGKLQPGMTTLEIDELATAAIKKRGAKAAFLGHEGFPKSVCVSVNEEIVHGIPGSRQLKEGDIVGLDLGITFEGLITDGAVTVPVGQIETGAQRLLKVTEEALYIGIDQAQAGSRVGDISAAIEAHLRKAGLGIVEELAGHGVGHELWEEPSISNLGSAGTGPTLKAGMTIAIEPMATLGNAAIKILDDGWTIATRDGSLAAQFEHTVLVTDGPAQILTSV